MIPRRRLRSLPQQDHLAWISLRTMQGLAATTATLACLALGACYNELDWREVASTQGRFRITLPAKPHEQTRTLDTAAGTLSMAMVSARAGEWLYGVGYADYPAGGELQGRIDAQRDALLRNIAGRIITQKTASLDGRVDRVVIAEGRNGDHEIALHARFVADGLRLYQIVAIGRKGGVSDTELDTFLDSFKIQN